MYISLFASSSFATSTIALEFRVEAVEKFSMYTSAANGHHHHAHHHRHHIYNTNIEHAMMPYTKTYRKLHLASRTKTIIALVAGGVLLVIARMEPPTCPTIVYCNSAHQSTALPILNLFAFSLPHRQTICCIYNMLGKFRVCGNTSA